MGGSTRGMLTKLLGVVRELTAYVISFTVDMSVAGYLTEGGGAAGTVKEVGNVNNELGW